MSKRAILNKKANLINKFMPLKNWAKYISLLTVLTLGVLLIPNASYACAKNMRETTRSSCAKKQEKDAQPKDFNKAPSCEKEKQHKKCNEQCKHNSCGCGTSAPTSGLPTLLSFHAKVHFPERTIQQFNFKQAHCSSGHSSIWLPPKIS
jgi:hypothetical protein